MTPPRTGWHLSRTPWALAIASLAACQPSPGAPSDAGGSTAGGSGDAAPEETEGQSDSSGVFAPSTSQGESTGAETGSAEPQPDEGCFAQEWSWRAQVDSTGAVALAHGDATAVLDSTGAEVRLLALDAAGSLVFDPTVVGEGGDADVAAGPNDAWWLVTRAAGASHLQVRSAEGLVVADHVVFPPGNDARFTDIAMTPDGNAVLGGKLDDGRLGQTQVVGVDPEGLVQWEYAGFDNSVHDVVVGPDGTTFAMTVATNTEGADVSVVGLDRDGVSLWSFLAGSHGGFGDERASPFGLALDGEGGVVTVGAEPGPAARADSWNALTERHDGDGQPRWQSEAGLAGVEAAPIEGDITRVGDLGFVAVVGGYAGTLVRLDLDGTARCQRRLSEELRPQWVVATSGDTVVVAGQLQDQPSASRHTWVAQFRVVTEG